MKNGIVISIFAVCGAIFFYWNSQERAKAPETNNQAPAVAESSAPESNSKPTKNPPTADPAKKQVDLKEVLSSMMGYWIVVNPLVKFEEKYHYQIFFQPIENPELHGGKEIEGLLFAYLQSNPAKQTLAKIEFDTLTDGKLHFKVVPKDVSKFYADGYYDQEGNIGNITIDPLSMSFNSTNAYNENAFASTIKKIDSTKSLENFKGSWHGFRSADEKKIKLDFSSIGNFVEDFGTAKISGDCSASSNFKVRSIDENIFLITIGNASCDLGSNVFKGMFKDGKLKTVNYRQFVEASEVEFSQD